MFSFIRCAEANSRMTISRQLSTTSKLQSKKNFRKFDLKNKRGTYDDKLRRHLTGEQRFLGVKPVGIKLEDGTFQFIPERVPELIVPDLTDCQLKPYVSYRAPDVTQSEFTPKDLFNAIYSQKILKDFKEGKLDEDGNPIEPSADEMLTPEEAYNNARKTGCDIFTAINDPALKEKEVF